MANKEIRRQRVYQYFIQACQQLIDEGGVEELTIRNISDRAGYNSATLYNYFDNLEQLIALALIDNVKPYLDAIQELYKSELSADLRFLITWREFSRYSFQTPYTFKRVFESSHSDSILSYIDVYFDYFPSKHYNEVRKFIFDQNMQTRDKNLMAYLIEEEIIQPESAVYLNDFAYALHLGICDRIINGYYKKDEDVLRLFMAYLVDFFAIYSTKKVDKNQLLEEVLSFKINYS